MTPEVPLATFLDQVLKQIEEQSSDTVDARIDTPDAVLHLEVTLIRIEPKAGRDRDDH